MRYLGISIIILTLFLVLIIYEKPGQATSPMDEHQNIPVLQSEKMHSNDHTDLIYFDSFIYLGAFRLPDDSERPQSFAWGGEAMTFNPEGNPDGSQDGFPGSLFIMGHDRMPYGELPDGNQVAEITIPTPIIADTVRELNQATFIQPFHNVAAGFFPTLVEIPRVGMEYLDTGATGPLIHLTWGQHFQDAAETNVASHAWFHPDLSSPNIQGTWYIGNQSLYSVNDYLFQLPTEWAEQYTSGRLLATGRFKDGGWSGMGPALFAYRPWIDDIGTPAAPGTRLQETVLLLYESSYVTEDIIRCMEGYQHPDEWTGGAWLTTDAGESAVLFAGTKATGDKYWYGFINPAGPEYACVERAYLGEFTLCRLADGTPCPDESLAVCTNPASLRGWWSSSFNARFILYSPDDLAAVASGVLEPWEPQPYAYLDIDEHLFLNPQDISLDVLGYGVQRRYRLGDIAYDRDNGLLYVLERHVEEGRPVVHVWQIQSHSTL